MTERHTPAIKLNRYELIPTPNIQHPISSTQYPTGEGLDQTLEHGCDGAQPSSNTSFCLMAPGCSPWILDIPCWLLDILFKILFLQLFHPVFVHSPQFRKRGEIKFLTLSALQSGLIRHRIAEPGCFYFSLQYPPEKYLG